MKISTYAFRPERIGCNTIYDAANPLGNNTLPADGTALGTIADVGLNGNTATQSTGANQPIFKRNIINNQHVFRFSGAQIVSCPGSSSNNYVGPMSIFLITKINASALYQHILCKQPNPATGGWGIGCDNSSPPQSFITKWGVADYRSSSTLITSGAFCVLGYVLKSDNTVDFYKDRNFTQNVAISAPTASSAPLVFGALNTTTDPLTGDVVAIYLFYRQLTTSEINAMLHYCNARIGI